MTNARMLSLLALGLVALGALTIFGCPSLGLALVGITLAVAIEGHRHRSRCNADRPAVAHLRRAEEELNRGDGYTALRTASVAVDLATTTTTRYAALRVVVRAALSQGYSGRAKEALSLLRAWRASDLPLRAAVYAARGDLDKAVRALDTAGVLRTLDGEGAMLLIELHARQRRLDRAAAVAVRARDWLGAERCRDVLRAVCAAGEYAPAAKLSSALFRMTGATDDGACLVLALSNLRDGAEVSRALDEFVGCLRRVGQVARARSLVAKLREDATLPKAARIALDRMHRRVEAAH